MERKQFLKSIGAGAAFALVFPCVHGCSSDSSDEPDPKDPPTSVDVTIDLNATSSSNLSANGGFILIKSKSSLKFTDIVVARNLEGNYVAASQICSHNRTDGVRFVSDNGGSYKCSTHGARFNQSGQPLNSITSNSLKVFQTSVTDNLLRIFE